MKVAEQTAIITLDHYYFLKSNKINNNLVLNYSGEYRYIKKESGTTVFKNFVSKTFQSMAIDINIKELSFKQIELNKSKIISVAVTNYDQDVILITNDVYEMQVLIFENQLKYKKIMFSLFKQRRLEGQIIHHHLNIIKIGSI